VHAGLVAAVVGIVLLRGALDISADPSRSSVIGPAVFPIAISVAMLACALGLVVRGLAAPAGEHRERDPDDEDGPEIQGDDLPQTSVRKLLVSAGLFTAYVVAFIPAGFLVSTIAFLTVLPTYIERGKVVRNAVFAVVFSVLVMLLFDRLLGVQLPSGNYTRS
jgi:putative tricarboxylic transport membrane protein